MDKEILAQPLDTCLKLNAVALAFSLTHATIDFSLVFQAVENGIGPSDIVAFLLGKEWVVGAFAATMAIVYGWWGWSLARAGGDGKSGLVSLLLLSLLWAGGNGASIVICPPPCGGVTPYKLYPDVSHVGSLIFGALASYVTFRVIRLNRVRSNTSTTSA